MLSKLIIPWWVKLIPGIIVLVLLATVAVLTNQLHHKQQQLDNETSQRAELAKLAGAENNWPSIRTHVRDTKQSVDNLSTALDKISQETLAAKQRADAADAALVREQAENAKRYAQSQQTIIKLEQQKSSGDASIDDQVIEQISKLPWLGWHASAAQFVTADAEQRYDYTHMQTAQLYRKRSIMLVPHVNQDELQRSWQSHYHVSSAELGNRHIGGYSVLDRNDGICEIHVVDPKVVWSSDARNTLGHELGHCFYGYWHGEVK